jgi:lipopolysaccharide export LptBFGC system permease protein LptF
VDGDLLRDVRIFAFTTGVCYLDLFAPEAELRRDSNRFPAALSLRNFQGLVQMSGGWQGISAEERIEPIANFRPSKLDPPKLSEMSMRQLLDERIKRRAEGVKDVTPIEVQIHRQAAFSFACLGFTLVGIPLGIRAHRRETNIGVAMALILLLLYYSFIIVAQSLDTKPHLYPQYLLWIPNLIFQAVGVYLIRRSDGRV